MIKLWRNYSREYSMYRVSFKNLNPRNAVENSVQIYHVMHLLCLNDFSCLDALLFVAQFFYYWFMLRTTTLCKIYSTINCSFLME